MGVRIKCRNNFMNKYLFRALGKEVVKAAIKPASIQCAGERAGMTNILTG